MTGLDSARAKDEQKPRDVDEGAGKFAGLGTGSALAHLQMAAVTFGPVVG